ncbi:hypothetical protein FOL47_004735 [Perkinsus chesapeaki]|uniref:PUM-HD domain-containing protein n=1 Tax=Perkinsus chesapeaki TaxID=330153 RepID=A0A7J6M1V5_PERCH|nr:hypothetical protein FOL47_004735 [Perkinsus chesapeaki]
MTDNNTNNNQSNAHKSEPTSDPAPPGSPTAVGAEQQQQSKLFVPGIRQVGPGNNDNAEDADTWEASPAGDYTVQQRKLRELIPKTPSPSYSYDVNFGQAQAAKDGQQPAPIMPRFFPFMAPPPAADSGPANQGGLLGATGGMYFSQSGYQTGAPQQQTQSTGNGSTGVWTPPVKGSVPQSDQQVRVVPVPGTTPPQSAAQPQAGVRAPQVFMQQQEAQGAYRQGSWDGQEQRRGGPRQQQQKRPSRQSRGGSMQVPEGGSTHAQNILAQLRARGGQLPPGMKLGDVAGDAVELAMDQYGSRFLQNALETATPSERHDVFLAVLSSAQQLTTDPFGNYVIQKLFDYLPEEHIVILSEQLLGDILRLSFHMYGCRVVQKVLENVNAEQQVLIVNELKGHVVECVEDQNGNHVIQKCIETLPTQTLGFIVDEFRGNVTRMSLHCYGCRVVQRLIERLPAEMSQPLMQEVVQNLWMLSQDQYGNYVVQHVVEHGPTQFKNAVVNEVAANIQQYGCHKFASNVVEKALVCGSRQNQDEVIGAVIGSAGPDAPLHAMTVDKFGNYVVQRCLELSQGTSREHLVNMLKTDLPNLRKVTYGKHIASAVEKLIQNPNAVISTIRDVNRVNDMPAVVGRISINTNKHLEADKVDGVMMVAVAYMSTIYVAAAADVEMIIS